MKSAISLLVLSFSLLLAVPILGSDRLTVTATITVKAGDTLHITPGNEYLFNAYTGITVMGHLKATGTKEQPIAFVSIADTTEGGGSSFDWNGIEIAESGSAELAYCLIANATSGLTADNARGLIIDKCIFKNNGQWHLSINGEIQEVTEGQPFTWTTAPVIPMPAELAASTQAPEPPPASTVAKPPTDTRRIWRWSLISAGTITAIGGIAELTHAQNIAKEYNAYAPGNAAFDAATPDERQQHYDRLRSRHSTARIVGWSLIGAAAADGVYVTFFF